MWLVSAKLGFTCRVYYFQKLNYKFLHSSSQMNLEHRIDKIFCVCLDMEGQGEEDNI